MNFWHLHLHYCVRLPHHSLDDSRTFRDLALKFPALTQDQTHFPWLSRAWKFYTQKSRTFLNFPARRRGNPDSSMMHRAETTNQTAGGDADKRAPASHQPPHQRVNHTSFQASFLTKHHRSHHHVPGSRP